MNTAGNPKKKKEKKKQRLNSSSRQGNPASFIFSIINYPPKSATGKKRCGVIKKQVYQNCPISGGGRGTVAESPGKLDEFNIRTKSAIISDESATLRRGAEKDAGIMRGCN